MRGTLLCTGDLSHGAWRNELDDKHRGKEMNQCAQSSWPETPIHLRPNFVSCAVCTLSDSVLQPTYCILLLCVRSTPSAFTPDTVLEETRMYVLSGL